jgi:hypothetical protein
MMAIPFVLMPDALLLMLDLLSTDTNLPAALTGKVVSDLSDNFPADLPWVTVESVSGASPRPIKIRLAQAAFDINVYAMDKAEASLHARTVAGILQSLEGKKNTEGGITNIEVTEPFYSPDLTTAHRWLIQALVTYRPL